MPCVRAYVCARINGKMGECFDFVSVFGGSKALEISHYRCVLGLWEGLGCSFQSAKTRSRLGPHRVAYNTLCKDEVRAASSSDLYTYVFSWVWKTGRECT